MTQQRTSWVYVVDDDPHVLKAFQRLLQTEGYNVAVFASPRAFLDAHDPALPGCALLDVGMAELSGLETQKELLALGNTRPVIFVTGHDDVQTGVLAMKSGARDYLIKPVPDTVLLDAVAAAVQSDITARRQRASVAKLVRKWHSLTGREREIMMHVVRGQMNKQTADDLKIVVKTVKAHRAVVMRKMGVRSLAELVHIAAQLERAGYALNAGNARSLEVRFQPRSRSVNAVRHRHSPLTSALDGPSRD